MPPKTFQPSRLLAAIRSGRLSEVIRAMEDGADLEEADIHGIRGLPLRTACFEGSMAIVRELLRAGVDINALASDGPGAPLRLALRGGHGEIAALLLQNGAEIPPGLAIDPAILARVGTLGPLPGEAPSSDHARASAPPAIDGAIEEVEVPSCYGTDTNLLTMDLLALEKVPDGMTPTPSQAAPGKAPAQQSGFWKSGRSD